MTKPRITRTLGQIHFEDLEPHRFEDLVRHLAYDFRQWQSIESTGRGGADDGFDVRAYEALKRATHDPEEVQRDDTHPMDGNLWMIQCKRTKQLGPKAIETIIEETVNAESPPYGYILAAPTNFSKTAHDKFRDALRSRGVMEFDLWGAGKLEDMLYQPKNDHILFAFFGISLISRRRSKTTEIRATVSVKNRLRRILGDHPSHQAVLLRDLQDTQYPYEDEYADFAAHPRWKAYSAVGFHPLGLIVSVAEHYAYLDEPKGEWDYTKAVNTVMAVQLHRQVETNSDQEPQRLAVKGFWELLERATRATLVIQGSVRFDSIAFVDDQGDAEYECPHLYVDFHPEWGPFDEQSAYLKTSRGGSKSPDDLTRIKVFPEKFSKPRFGTIHRDKCISVDAVTRAALENRHCQEITVYTAGQKHGFLGPADVIGVAETESREGNKRLLRITNVRTMTGKELLGACRDDPRLKAEIERQIDRKLRSADVIQVTEAAEIQDWQIEQDQPVL